MPANARQPRNIQDDMGMDGTAFQVTENKAMEDKWQKITRKLQDLSVKQVNNGGTVRETQLTARSRETEQQVNNGGTVKETAHRKIKGDTAGLGRNKKKFENK
ncbi:hypothetical protein CRYUN_Cryun20dG0057100 [Craigia yunnanensis]